ncbi:rod-determining factor RdfA [Halorarius litoreus]|uniref:rod-determining factor RdfA n=1 Tax=Halorarius litoreus TaxID=2962676 RepID=UPI0020CE953C|nr:rod-determining factor RdfA [Halorarius litoreus]
MTDTPDSTDAGGRRSKVGRLIDTYELDRWNERLARRWTEERTSLRDLADQFNRGVLLAAMSEAGLTPSDSDVENTYELLTDDGVSRGDRVRAETRLRQAGIDVEELRGDFVSHQAIHTHLTKHLGVSLPESDDGDRIEKTAGVIQRLKSRLQAVAESNLQSLVDTDRLSLGSFSVLVDVRVYCSDCGTQYELTELLDQGGCDC